MSSTRIAMVGAGSVARRHVGVLSGLPDTRVVAVCDPVEEAAVDLARECDARAFTDTEQALEYPDLDAVYICVPPFAHGMPEKAVLARGLAMFVEKPVAVDLAVAEELGARVAEAGVVTGTGYHWRCLDVLPHAQDLLEASPPLLASGYWLDKRPPVAWWGRADRSGGQVIEQLTHVLDLTRMLLGEVSEVYAAGARQHLPAAPDGTRSDQSAEDLGDVDDATAATVRFASGVVATLAATSLLDAKHRAALHTMSRGLVLELSETGMVVDDGRSRTEHTPQEDPRTAVDRDFVAAVRGELAQTRAPYAEALRSHRVGCAVAESARTGRPVTLAAR